MKYLGLHLNSKLSYWSQIIHVVGKAGKAALQMLNANVSGPTASNLIAYEIAYKYCVTHSPLQ